MVEMGPRTVSFMRVETVSFLLITVNSGISTELG